MNRANDWAGSLNHPPHEFMDLQADESVSDGKHDLCNVYCGDGIHAHLVYGNERTWAEFPTTERKGQTWVGWVRGYGDSEYVSVEKAHESGPLPDWAIESGLTTPMLFRFRPLSR